MTGAVLKKRTLITLVQYLVGFVAIGVLVRQISWSDITGTLVGVGPETLALLVAVSVSGYLAAVYRWYWLANRFSDLRFVDATRIVFSNYFVGQFVPSQLSSFLILPVLTRRHADLDLRDGIALTFTSTGMYGALYAAVTGIGLWLLWPIVPRSGFALLVLSTSLYVGFAVLLVVVGYVSTSSESARSAIGNPLSRLPLVGSRLSAGFERLWTTAADSSGVVRTVTSSPGTVVRYAVAWGVTIAVTPALRFSILFDAVGGPAFGVLYLAVYVVTAYSVTALPVTPGGLGIAEFATVVVFGALGVPQSVVLPVVLVDRFFGIYLPGILGGIPASNFELRETTAE